MKIAFDAAPLLHTPTGVGHYTRSLLTELLQIDQELEVDLWTVSLRGDTSKVPKAGRLNLKHVRLPARVVVAVWETIGRPYAESVFGPVDVVHGTNFWVPPLKRINGVVTIHDLTFRLFPELCTPAVQRYKWIVPKVLKRCALILTPSKTVAEQVVSELGFPEDRIVVTPEGVRGSFVGAQPDPALGRRMGINGPYVLFAGTQEPRKNLDRLLTSFSQVEGDLQLVIVGPQGWGSVDLPALATKLHLGKKVIFSGYLPDADLAALVAGARAFVFPTLYEGFGLPPLEAMAAGIPVVSSDGGSLPEVLGDAPIYCDPLDIESITAAINKGAWDESVRASAVSRGLAQAARYNWRETAELTYRAYKRVASDSGN